MTATTMAVAAPATIVIPNEHQIASKIQDLLGHSVSVVGNGVSKIGNGLFGAIQATVWGAFSIFKDSCATASVFRKLDQYTLRLIEHINHAPGSLSQFQLFLRRNVAFIDLAQLAADIHYAVSGRFKEVYNAKEDKFEKEKDNALMVTGKLAALAANTGGALLWFNEMGLVSLSKAAEVIGETRIFSAVPSILSSIPALKDFPKLHTVAKAIGEFRVFSFIKHTSCLFVTLRALDLMYTCFAVDAGNRLLNADSRIKAISAGLDLSSYLAELTLSAMLLAGVTNVVGLGVFGTACIVLAASSHIYRAANEKEVKRKV
jgi:hypothetical protein